MESLQDLVSKGTHSAFMKNNKLWSEERSMRFSGVTDVKGERRKQEKERLREHPIVRAYIDQQLLSEEPGLTPIVEELVAAEQEEAAGAGVRNIGGPAPRGGGRSAGTPKQPGGTRQVRQPREFR